MLQGARPGGMFVTPAPAAGSAASQPTEAKKEEEGGEGGAGSVPFRVMLKRGGREERGAGAHAREVLLPASSHIVQNMAAKARKEEGERQLMKKLVLQVGLGLGLGRGGITVSWS